MSTYSTIVGKSASLRFTQQRGFRKALNERVNAYLRANDIPARDVPAMYLKTAVALAWWLGAYLLLLLGHFPPLVNVVLCVVWALSIASVGFNVMHDASHDGYSDHPRVNRLMSFSGEMLGMSGFRWRTKHNVWHHTYTNIAGFDDDVETYGLMRLTPRARWKPLYKVQAWYFPVVYSLIGFDFILRDFSMVLIGKSDADHVYPKMSAADKVTFWAGKLFFFVIMFALPLLVFPWWQVLIGFLIVMLTVGLVMGVIFQLAHINGDAAFPEPVGNPPHIDNEWAVHQVETTVDFAPHNWLLTRDIDYTITQFVMNTTSGTLRLDGANHNFMGYGYCERNWGVQPRHSTANWLHFWMPDLAGVVLSCTYDAGVPHHYTYLWRPGQSAYLFSPAQFSFAPDALESPWQCQSPDLSLRATPLYMHHTEMRLPPILSYIAIDYYEQLVQVKGTATVEGTHIEIDGIGKYNHNFNLW